MPEQDSVLQRLCDARGKPLLVYMGTGRSGGDFAQTAKLARDALGNRAPFESLDVLVYQWETSGVEAAPALINVLQAASEELVAIVPYRAAGLAGVIALSCEKLLMGDLGHFGPMRAQTLQERRKAQGSLREDRLAYPDDAVHAISDFGANFANLALSRLARFDRKVPREELPRLAIRLAHLLTEPLLSSITAEQSAEGLADQQATFQSLDTALRKCRVQRKDLLRAVRALAYEQMQIFDRTWLGEYGISASTVSEPLMGLIAEIVAKRDEIRSKDGVVSLHCPTDSAASAAKAPRRTQASSRTKKPRKTIRARGKR